MRVAINARKQPMESEFCVKWFVIIAVFFPKVINVYL